MDNATITRLRATVTVDGVEQHPAMGLDFEAHHPIDFEEVALWAIELCGPGVVDACSKPFRFVEHPAGALVSGKVAVRFVPPGTLTP